RARRGTAMGDADAFDLANARLGLRRQLAREARADVAGLTGLIRAACAATRRHARVRARVTALDPAAGLARLSDGTQLVYGAAAKATGLAQGALVSASGAALAGQVLVADSIEGGLVTKFLQPTCSFTLRIAPVQDFAQGNDEILYYDERGYRSGDGTYQLEGGMGLGAVRGSACTADDYALDVYLDYTNADGKVVNKLLGALRGVEGFEPPLRIPMDVGKTAAKLRFELWSLDCETPKDVTVCNIGQLEDKRSAPAIVRRQGAWGTASYDRVVFSVEDGSTTDFDTATLVGVNAPALPGASVFGVGYAIAGGASQRPTRSYILEGQQFAVHDDVPTQDDPAGLLWAYVNGTRDGHPYHYVATLPNIVTDVVDFCPNKGPSLYRLPWKANTLQMVTQGNASEPTHSGGQRYAFDFKMPLLTSGYATRGGVVTLVEEKRTKQSNPKAVKYWKQVTGGKLDLWQPGNTLLIRHQDGSTSLYTHMMPNGIVPEVGDVVERGDRITVTGATGNVTGPHLHYHVSSTGDDENAALGNTIPISFEVAALPAQPVPCVVPKRGQAWLSTNSKPSS
ncbi:MAG TPA: M23 family metallopeptidase, partial [Baekduia sp.]|nr:M23 family metallopeptidase [Baekduia sp.]